MKKNILLYLAIVVALYSCVSQGVNEYLPMENGRPLRDIVAEKYPEGNVYIGGTTGWTKSRGTLRDILDREFSYITPENDFKQSTIHPSPGVWSWNSADSWMDHAVENNQVIRIHGPIGPQCSPWAMNDDRTAAELQENLEEYFTALCQRYDGQPQVRWLDVVNETVSTNGQWFGPKPGVDSWENPWTILGRDESVDLKPPLYIKMAFEIANQYAPNTELIINQHGSMEQAMWNKVKALVPYLRDQGLRVDGIGWQAHIDVGWEKIPGNQRKLHQLIDWAHDNDLSFHVTEQNVWLKQGSNYQAQAATFEAVLRILLEHRDRGVVTWNTWNISDADGWDPAGGAWRGQIYDYSYEPKPAYYAIQRLLENPPEPLPDGS
ncbi:MAG: endo-1,4-beta-xylanase [Spirochaetaceae bacterium]|jgi:endo-1,4-beta-xylanase|nr:endo-1,4-beta-xylanase [Spirochaetaceae bacterium]